MKKSVFRKIIIMVIALTIVFAFTATAYASYYAHWRASKCLYGFTTTNYVSKSSGQTWDAIIVYVDRLEFARETENGEYLECTPKTASGATMATESYVAPYTWPWIEIENYKTSSNRIYLRFDNPNSGNNAKSEGDWVGYLIE